MMERGYWGQRSPATFRRRSQTNSLVRLVVDSWLTGIHGFG